MKRAEAESYKKKLYDRRAELQRLIEVSKEGRKPVELDQSRVGRLSRMDALQDQAMALETGRRRDIELQRIKAALKRLDDDEFGYCLSCGEEIEAKRLAFDPTAPLCIDCAQTG
jgi:DnaK suppressor protein